MADPLVRRRTAVMAAVLFAVTWAMVTLLGRPTGAFTDDELPELAGLPIRVPQIERILPPRLLEPSPASAGAPGAPEEGSATP